MIFTIKNADFSKSNIGTLNSWRVKRILKGVTANSSILEVEKDAKYTDTFTVTDGYTFNSAVVTMGNVDISSKLVWDTNKKVGTLTIDKVTNDVYISIIAYATGGEIIDEDLVKQMVWYSDFKDMTRNSNASLSYASYSYNDESLIANYINKPIHAFRMEVVTPGKFSYGKTDGTTYTELGSLNITVADAAGLVDVYELEEPITLVEGERLWFCKSDDTAIIKYGSGQKTEYPTAGFDVKMSASNPKGNANTAADALGVDIGGYAMVKPEEAEPVWYYELTNRTTVTANSGPGTASFAYNNPSTIKRYVGKPINLFRFAVGKIGTFDYGKFDGQGAYEKLGTIQLTELHDEPRMYEVEEFTLNQGENIWFQGRSDTGAFKYNSSGGPTDGKFYYNVIEGATSFNSSSSTLCIDIGHIVKGAAKVAAVNVSPKTITLSLGEEAQLTAEIVPDNAKNKNVTWSASNSNCAVTQDGKVVALNAGDCIITVKTEDGGYEDKCTITVVNEIPSAWYVKGIAGLEGNTGTSTISAASFAYKDAIFTDACIGKPINAFKFAVAKAGTFTYGKVGTDIASTYEILGTIELTNPSYDPQTFIVEEFRLSDGERVWFQGIDDDGLFYYGAKASLVTGYTGFNTYVHPNRNISTGSSVLGIDIGYVNENQGLLVDGVELEDVQVLLTVGESYLLKANISPADAGNKNLIWETDNERCSVVNGVVTALEPGDCTITVRTEDGGYEDTCVVRTLSVSSKWYVNTTSVSDLNGTSDSSGFFAYQIGTSEYEACLGKTINAFRLVTATAGNVTYGKTDGTTVTELGSFDIIKDSKNKPQMYFVPEFTLADNERVIISKTTDSGRFKYGNTTADQERGVGNFNNKISTGSPNGASSYNYNLSVDIGYMDAGDVASILTGVAISYNEVNLLPNDTFKLKVNPVPVTSELPNVVWSASNSNCTVAQDGTVTAVAAGTCVITVKTEDNLYSASCTIKVVDLDNTDSDWYILAASASTRDRKSVPSAASFAYKIDTAYREKPINAFVLAVAQAGTLSYGIYENGVSYKKLGTLNLTNPSTEPQLFMIDPIILHGESLWFQSSDDTGLFWFGGSISSYTYVPGLKDNPGYYTYITESTKTHGGVGSDNLAIDIGYVNETQGAKLADIGISNYTDFIQTGSSLQLEAQVIPGSLDGTRTWSLVSGDCCTITSEGLLTANTVGTCVIKLNIAETRVEKEFVITSLSSEPTWHVSALDTSKLVNNNGGGTGGYMYYSDSDISALQGQSVNLFRLSVTKDGTFAYGKTDGTTVTELGTINVTSSTNPQIFMVDTFNIAEGENVWMTKTTDTCKFRYCSSTSEVGNFVDYVSSSNPNGKTQQLKNLSIDIGYSQE